MHKGSSSRAEGSNLLAGTGGVGGQSCEQGRAKLGLLLRSVFGDLPLLELACIRRGAGEAAGVSNCLCSSPTPSVGLSGWPVLRLVGFVLLG